MRSHRIALTLALALAAAAPALGHVDLPTNLDAAQETPTPTLPDGANPTAVAALVLENDNSIEYQITVSGLTGPPVAAHIHEAPAGTPGPIVIALDHNTLAGTTLPLTDAQLRALFRGELYVNVHTAANVAGEIRGQIVPPAPACDCDTLGRKAFKKCVKTAVKQLEPDERQSDAAKALKRAAKKASCGRTSGPRRAIGCCLPRNPFENIATDGLCAVVPEGACSNLGGTRLADSCFPQNPCSPSGAFLDPPAGY